MRIIRNKDIWLNFIIHNRISFGITIAISLFLLMSFAKASPTSTTIEQLGTITANQAENGLGFNIDANQDWEWAAAAAAGAKYGRIQCSWSSIEQQTAPPSNRQGSTPYVEDPNCALGFASAKRYGINATVVAAYGPPYHRIVTVEIPNGAALGATSLDIVLSSGVGGDTLSNLQFPYDYIALTSLNTAGQATSSNGPGMTSHHSYEGSFISAATVADPSHATITLASALTTALPANASYSGCSINKVVSAITLNCPGASFTSTMVADGQITIAGAGASGAPLTTTIATIVSPTEVTLAASASASVTNAAVSVVMLYNINEILYPSAATELPTDPSVVAYGNYVKFLASDMAARGVTGDIEMWNEPPWANDPWDNRCDLYDDAYTPCPLITGSGQIAAKAANFGFAANLMNAVMPTGITVSWGGTDKTGAQGLLGSRMLSFSGTSFVQPSATIRREYFHPYGFEPEQNNWSQACVNSLVANYPSLSLTHSPNVNSCLVTIGSTSNSIFAALTDIVQKYLYGPTYGIGHGISETGILPYATGMGTQNARFTIRQFLAFQANGVTPIEFYRFCSPPVLSNGTPVWDTNFSFVSTQGSGSSACTNPNYSPLQNLTALSGLISDIAPISNAPIAAYTSSTLPSVSSYSGTFPLTSVHMVGARANATANSDMLAVWQRSFVPMFTGSVSGTILTVTAMTNTGAPIAAGQMLSTGYPGPTILPFGTAGTTGTGGVGTYALNSSATAAAGSSLYTLWLGQPQPAPGTATVAIPSGMSVSAVINLTTRVAVGYTSASGHITFPVSDDPIEVLVDPTPPVSIGSPSTGSPSTGSPSTGSPSTGSPSTGSPSTGSPSTGSPSTGSPSTGSPSTGSPSTGSPSTGSPSTGSPTPIIRTIVPIAAPTTINAGSTATEIDAQSNSGVSTIYNFKPVYNGDLLKFTDTTGTISISSAAKAGVLWVNGSNAPVEWQMNGTAVPAAAVIGIPTPGYTPMALGDFNGDGTSDILWIPANGRSPPLIWFMKDTHAFSAGFIPYPSVSAKAWTGDFNGDGQADILWDNGGAAPVIWEMSGTNVIDAGFVGNALPNYHIAGTGDFDGDGKSDILWAPNTVGQYPVIWLVKGLTATGVLLPYPAPSTTAWVGNFSGDGHCDILWDMGPLPPVLWEMSGTTVIGGGTIGFPLGGHHIASVGDFYGNGKTDILWAPDVANQYSVLWSLSGFRATGSIMPYPSASTQALIGSFHPVTSVSKNNTTILLDNVTAGSLNTGNVQ